MDLQSERLKILKKVEAGEFTLDEADSLLQDLDAAARQSDGECLDQDQFDQLEEGVQLDDMEVPGQTEFPPKADADPAVVDEMDVLPGPDPVFDQARLKRWERWRHLPLFLAILTTVLGASWIYMGWKADGFGWGFFLAWIPFLLGVLGILLFWNTRWLHVRVQQKPGEKPQHIQIDLPLPLGAGSWFFKTFGNRIPMGGKVRGEDVDGILESLNNNEPIHILVDEEDGERVEVYIG
ncbi:MAG TPA: hypothetical protein PKN11_02620 [Anaerolineaceae bacterium]|nr:hypothetical protein [Anaerolineaceae bacterium]